jgi:hypothetical protein
MSGARWRVLAALAGLAGLGGAVGLGWLTIPEAVLSGAFAAALALLGMLIWAARQVHAGLTAMRDAVERLPAELADWFVTAAETPSGAVQARLPDVVYQELEAHANLLALINPRAPMPPLGGWALDAGVLQAVVEALWRRPGLVVECGSGASSVWLGYIVERLGTGRVVAIEHDEHYLRRSTELVRAHHLEETVEIRHAPLEPWIDEDDEHYQWYTVAALADLADIALLLVDGPPGATGPQARYPAGPELIPRCAGDAVIILDDTTRADERATSDRWLARWPALERTRHRRGAAHVFRRTGTG